jgi:H+/Cl- antiporter ClcA
LIDRQVEHASTTGALPVSPSMGAALEAADVEYSPPAVDNRLLVICGLSIVIAAAAAIVAQILVRLIALITNLSFYGRFSFEHVAPGGAVPHLGLWVIAIPVIGGIIVGYMARYGSKAIRGHGIPEAMEQILTNQSRIPPRITFLKPISSAIAIGTGGPFGAEGPIIATGGALGSLVGQILRTTAAERKVLLAAGAAAGMSATFGAPASAVLLAIELLVFEFRPRSLIPVALASVTAAAVRLAFGEHGPMFAMPNLQTPSGLAIASYVVIGALVGVLSVVVTKLVYAIEDGFEHLPVHWMWWPAIGSIAVGVVGYFAPRTLGVGYDNISGIISQTSVPYTVLSAVAFLGLMKLISWSIALGSGTSGGTLAPLFTIGSGAGALMGAAAFHFMPHAGIDIRIAALVGMAAIFAGASRALLASAVFAFETTLQPLGLLPLLGGCSAAYLVSCFMMRHTIMTEKIARRGVRVPVEYVPDFLAQITVIEAASRNPVTLRVDQTLEEVRAWFASHVQGTRHQGFPVLNGDGHIQGVVTRRQLLAPEEPATRRVGELIRMAPRTIYSDATLREAADRMVDHDIGRLPVVERETMKLVGMITRSDLLSAHRRRLRETREAQQGFVVPVRKSENREVAAVH